MGMKLEDLADAYLYLGDLLQLSASYPSPDLFRNDPAYVKELSRRYELMFRGRAFPEASLYVDRSREKFYAPPNSAPPKPRT